MPLFQKLSSGKIFEDYFAGGSMNPSWQASPTDPARYSVTDKPGYLRLKHGDTPLYFLVDMPNRDFVFEVQTDYTPTDLNESAGIVVFQDNKRRMELLEYIDPESQAVVNYTHMRVSRKGSLYTGYGSRDGGTKWEIIGSGAADGMTKLGLVVNHATGANFDVQDAKIFSDTLVSFGNLKPGMRVELCDATNTQVISEATCPATQDYVYISLAALPIPYNGVLKIYSETGTLLEMLPAADIWGGDSYWYGLMLDVKWNGVQMTVDKETALGYMNNGIIETYVEVTNPGTDPVHGVRASKATLGSLKGSEWVQLAEDVGNAPGVYNQALYLGTINPGETRKVWIKITKDMQDALANIGNRKFLLQFTN